MGSVEIVDGETRPKPGRLRARKGIGRMGYALVAQRLDLGKWRACQQLVEPVEKGLANQVAARPVFGGDTR